MSVDAAAVDGVGARDVASARRAALGRWRKQRGLAGLVLMLAGLVLVVVGSARIGTQEADAVSQGAWIGSAGILCIVVGGLLCRLAVAGPFPRDLVGPGLQDEVADD